jgi:hypothetical protein
MRDCTTLSTTGAPSQTVVDGSRQMRRDGTRSVLAFLTTADRLASFIDRCCLPQYRAVLPTPYPIPNDGPVGGLLKSLNRHVFRPAHLHM